MYHSGIVGIPKSHLHINKGQVLLPCNVAEDTQKGH